MSEEFKYRIAEVDFVLGVAWLEIQLKTGEWERISIDIYSIAASNEDTKEQLEAAIDEVVLSYYSMLYPKPVPAPAALLELVGNEYARKI